MGMGRCGRVFRRVPCRRGQNLRPFFTRVSEGKPLRRLLVVSKGGLVVVALHGTSPCVCPLRAAHSTAAAIAFVGAASSRERSHRADVVARVSEAHPGNERETRSRVRPAALPGLRHL